MSMHIFCDSMLIDGVVKTACEDPTALPDERLFLAKGTVMNLLWVNGPPPLLKKAPNCDASCKLESMRNIFFFHEPPESWF